MTTIIDRTVPPPSLDRVSRAGHARADSRGARAVDGGAGSARGVSGRGLVVLRSGWSTRFPRRRTSTSIMTARTSRSWARGRKHEDGAGIARRLVETITEEFEIPCKGVGETTWKRLEIARGLEADECYYFLPEKLAADAAAACAGL